MRTDLQFEFTVDKPNKTVHFTREFDAEPSLVWDAFTKAELLDQWWAPQPFLSKTKVMEFKEGGRRFYAMVSPDGAERWAVQKYLAINPKTHFKFFNTFADKDENMEMPGSEWDFNFKEHNGGTLVSISIYNESLERMERILEMGFKEGMTMTLGHLEALLERLHEAR
ncbi:MAG: SRPBCC domain-containing protein [Chitinophagaceae bacterium]|nr:SRPBCC domain-containing protein [Chitinophagaceae bacterium]